MSLRIAQACQKNLNLYKFFTYLNLNIFYVTQKFLKISVLYRDHYQRQLERVISCYFYIHTNDCLNCCLNNHYSSTLRRLVMPLRGCFHDFKF